MDYVFLMGHGQDARASVGFFWLNLKKKNHFSDSPQKKFWPLHGRLFSYKRPIRAEMREVLNGNEGVAASGFCHFCTAAGGFRRQTGQNGKKTRCR
jgi:hypothetical protein